MTDEAIETHPVQRYNGPQWQIGQCPKSVTMAAYEVYSHVFKPQPAMITGTCRGGFGVGELIAFLYARSFPKSEWKDRVDEALRGMKNI